MSFDIFFQCFRNGENTNFDRVAFEEVFGRHATEIQGRFERVVYPNGGADIYGASEEEEIDGLMFNHAWGDIFYNALVELADRLGATIYWPDIDGPRLAVTRQDVVEHLPEEMVEAIGPAFIVRTGDELYGLINGPVDPANS